MEREGFNGESHLDTQELAELLTSFSELGQGSFSLRGPRWEPLVAHHPLPEECKAACKPPDLAADLDGLLVQVCPLGALRVVSAVRVPGRKTYYVMGCRREAEGNADAPLLLEKAVARLRDLAQIAIRRTVQLEGLAQETLLRFEELNVLYQMGESLISGMPIDEIVVHMLERAVDITDAQGGAIVLFEEGEPRPEQAEADYLTVQAAIGWGSDLAYKGKRFLAGEGAIGHALVQDRPQALDDVLDGQLYGDGSHVVELQSMLCIPLFATSRSMGGMILVNKSPGGNFTAGDEKLGWAVATQVAIAIENSRLQNRIREEERIRAVLQRYVSPNVERAVRERRGLEELLGERWLATILFVDIRDFSVVVEQTPPDVMIAVLNEYFQEITDAIFRYDGAIDEFAGDELLTFFGIPFAAPNAAENAVRAAVEIVRRHERLCASWRRREMPTFRIGLGMTTGWVSVGNIGSERRMELTVIGPPVVVASRVEQLNKVFGTRILITQDTLEHVRDIVNYRDRGVAVVKGISTPIHVYEITGLREGTVPIA